MLPRSSLFVIAIALSLAACGGASSDSQPGGQEAVAPPQTDPEAILSGEGESNEGETLVEEGEVAPEDLFSEEGAGAAQEETEEEPPENEAAAEVDEAEVAAVQERQSRIDLPQVDPLDVEGNLVISGSATIYPLVQAMYDRFVQEGYGGIIRLSSLNTTTGFELFCQKGEIDIANATRTIEAAETQACREIGRQPVGFRIGTDALAIVIHPENEFLETATLRELSEIFLAENWSDVNEDWPEEPILRYIPSEEQGTFRFFTNRVFGGRNRRRLLNAPNTETSSDNELLVQGVAANKHAIGFFGYAYYQENAKNLKILPIGEIEPTLETVDAAQYPLSRSLYIYADANALRDEPHVAAFVNYTLTNINAEIRQAGYFPASPVAIDRSKSNFLQAIGYYD